MRTEGEIRWLAGLIEGDGSFYVGREEGRPPRGFIVVTMTDRDVVEAIPPLFGGHVAGPFKNTDRLPSKNGQLPVYRWQLQDCESIVSLGSLLYPWMFSRRRGQLDRVLTVAGSQVERRMARAKKKAATAALREQKIAARTKPCDQIEVSHRGYKMHQARGETLCHNCRQSKRLYERAYLASRNVRPSSGRSLSPVSPSPVQVI